MQALTIIIGGDLVPTVSNASLFSNGDVTELVGEEIFRLLHSVDYRIFNLEVPLVDIERPILKCGPNLIAPTSTINGIKALNPTVVSLANNHILDHDEQGLMSTISILNNNGIMHLGAGQNIAEAAKGIYLKKDIVTVGVYACAESEFSIATDKTAGANPFDPLESLDQIQMLKNECDIVIVLYHGGKEHYRYPSPYLQRICRKMVNRGADLILCQHSHCIGACEAYMGATIVYGQGNFIFDASDDECWETSLLIKVIIEKKLKVEYIPICKNRHGVKLANEPARKKILDEFNYRSKKIAEPNFIDSEYEILCKNMGEQYLRCFAGYGRIMSKLDRLARGFIIKNKYSTQDIVAIRNFIECEAHRELVLRYLNQRQHDDC